MRIRTLLTLVLFPTICFSQKIPISDLLRLQRKKLIEIQNYLDSCQWSLSRTVDLSEADSLFWENRVQSHFDSLAKNQSIGTNTKKNRFDSTTLRFYSTDVPVYLIHYPIQTKTFQNLTPNDFTIRLQNEILFHSIALGINEYWAQSFHISLELTYEGNNISSLLKDIQRLQIPKDSSYIIYEKKSIKRVYLLRDQVLTLTTFNLTETSDSKRIFSIEVFSKGDYLYFNDGEKYLRKKVANIE